MADNELAELIAEDAQEELAERRAVIECIKPLWEARQARKLYTKDETKYDPDASDYGKMGKVRRWLWDHGGEIWDDEAGYGFKLGSGGPLKTYDPVNVVRERSPLVFQRLLELGCLEISATAVARELAAGRLIASDLAGFVTEGERTPRLIDLKREK